MDFIENDETVLVALEEERRIAQFAPVSAVFKVKIKCAALFSDIESKRCLTDLAWSDKSDSSLIVERLQDTLFDKALYQPCILSITTTDLQENQPVFLTTRRSKHAIKRP